MCSLLFGPFMYDEWRARLDLQEKIRPSLNTDHIIFFLTMQMMEHGVCFAAHETPSSSCPAADGNPAVVDAGFFAISNPDRFPSCKAVMMATARPQ
jgi:hypothetical protein